MLLRSAGPSPFGRKIKMAARHLGLMDKIEVVMTSTADETGPLRKENPLGKIPVLILDDGRAIYDSPVILEALDHLAGGGKIIPTEWNARLETLTWQALADGVLDASILVIYEARFRPEGMRHTPWVEYQRDKIDRGVASLLIRSPDPKTVDVGTITIACALGYLDFRKQLDWRAKYPGLIGWLDAFRGACPAFDATIPAD